jgi:uncharacterized protein (TIGR02145 family)
MKKFITFILGITLVYSCSSGEDGNNSTNVVPLAPSNLTGNIASSTQINLTWKDNSNNESGFKIQRKTGNETYLEIIDLGEGTLTFSDSGLTPNTSYTYRVYAYNAIGNSITYSNELTIIIPINEIGPNLTDIDGYTYESITNCDLTFTKQNLNVSKYTDGTPIPHVTNDLEWGNLTTGAWCYYNNSTSNGTTYGKLYNWYAVMGIYDAASLTNPALRKKLAPTGWHISSKTEWNLLVNCLGGEAVAGGKMKSIGTSLWQSPNWQASNSSGFTGLPGGFRTFTGSFSDIGVLGYWWTSSESSPITYAWVWGLNHNLAKTFIHSYLKVCGMSVRCIKD